MVPFDLQGDGGGEMRRDEKRGGREGGERGREREGVGVKEIENTTTQKNHTGS